MTGESDLRNNPYPGLRPFRSDEIHLFFGRDEQRTELLSRLRRSRFLAVVGTSGSGKSSLVRAGLLPGLYGGFMGGGGSRWRVVDTRPGSDPIGRLAAALDAKGALRDDEDLDEEDVSFTETTLRRSGLGLVQAVKEARIPAGERVLVLVDQFEEIFRFIESAHTTKADDDARAFVTLLLEAAGQTDLPIYVVLTMRSDFLGDCARFRGLPEAINDGQYLIPRLTRDQHREAIEGPAAVAGAPLSSTLVNRLLNDVGDVPDQLPILQHALMRTWDHWKTHDPDGEVVDLVDYEETGGMAEALSRHADAVLEGLSEGLDHAAGQKRRQIAGKLFKCLTEVGEGSRRVRRLAQLQEIADVANAEVTEVASVIEAFRQPGNSFLMPPIGEALEPETYIDISHESLIRNWSTLRDWVDEEAASADVYKRLVRNAQLHRKGEEDLLGGQALGVAKDWIERQQPSAAWAERYDPAFDMAMDFRDESDRSVRSQEERRTGGRRARRAVLAGLALATLGGGVALLLNALVQADEGRIRAIAQARLEDGGGDELLATLYARQDSSELDEIDDLGRYVYNQLREYDRPGHHAQIARQLLLTEEGDSYGPNPSTEELADGQAACDLPRADCLLRAVFDELHITRLPIVAVDDGGPATLVTLLATRDAAMVQQLLDSSSIGDAAANMLELISMGSPHAIVAEAAIARREREQLRILANSTTEDVRSPRRSGLVKALLGGTFTEPLVDALALTRGEKVLERGDYVDADWEDLEDLNDSLGGNVLKLDERIEFAKIASALLRLKGDEDLKESLEKYASFLEPPPRDTSGIWALAFKRVMRFLSRYRSMILLVLVAAGPWLCWVSWLWVQRRLGRSANATPNVVRPALASLADVIVGLLLSVSLGAVVAVLAQFGVGLFRRSFLGLDAFNLSTGTFLVAAATTLVAYLLFRDAIRFRFRRSIGKILFDLRPVAADGGPVTMTTSAKRNWLLSVFALIAVPLLSGAFRIGPLVLAPNFEPFEVRLDSVGGSIDLMAALDDNVDGLDQSECGGYVGTSAPSLLFELRDESDSLRIYFRSEPDSESDRDTRLVIRDPRGWRCNDDNFGVEPAVDWLRPDAGRYEIWVTSFSAEVFHSGTLFVTGDAEPEPFTKRVPAVGGQVAVSGRKDPEIYPDLEECGGYGSNEPTFILDLSGASDELRIRFVSDSRGDTRLVVRDPGNEWVCNDDDEGLDPAVYWPDAESGRYYIWVTAFSRRDDQSDTPLQSGRLLIAAENGLVSEGEEENASLEDFLNHDPQRVDSNDLVDQVDNESAGPPESNPLGTDSQGGTLGAFALLASFLGLLIPIEKLGDRFAGTTIIDTRSEGAAAAHSTGSGWIASPAGAYVADPSLTGKAAFGFVATYKKGKSTPDANTEFQFKPADLNFRCSSYEGLVVTGTGYARFKGEGLINGCLDGKGAAYKFVIWAGDGSPDTFRIKIWSEDAAGVETVVYDNGFDQELGGGSIRFHSR